ncbi:hypothetical protein [Bradyrhizobium sp. USDA 3315]
MALIIRLPFFLKTAQGEGGINRARKEWLQSIKAIAKIAGALLIVDDIEML